MPTPIFDIDDLSFFYTFGLGFRHVRLARGLNEVQNGGERGDAVSLANFGYGERCPSYELYQFNDRICSIFQTKLELFIKSCFERSHRNTNYNGAAFLLIDRGIDARDPYDFGSYLLGKCGTARFPASAIMSMISTKDFHNEDSDHAVYNTMMQLKSSVKELKLQQAQVLLDKIEEPELKALLGQLIKFYLEDLFISLDVFKVITDLSKLSPDSSNYPEQVAALKTKMQQLDLSRNKGNQTLEVVYKPFELTQFSQEELKSRLIHFIEHQNLDKVRLILAHLPQGIFDVSNSRYHPLWVAAQLNNLDILKAVYEYDPTMYEQFQHNPCESTPLHIAARYGTIENLLYLLSLHTITERDMKGENNRHILHNAVLGNYEKVVLLLKLNDSIGNDITDRLSNPLALCSSSLHPSTERIFSLLLPRANYLSKYLAIISLTDELYYVYGRQGRKQLSYDANDARQYFSLRAQILESLTPEESGQLKEYYLARKTRESLGAAENILIDDLLDFEVQTSSPAVTENIQKTFGDYRSPKLETGNHTFFAKAQPSASSNQQPNQLSFTG